MNTDLMFSSTSEEWYTPECVLRRVYAVLGCPVALDPCSAGRARICSRMRARTRYTSVDDGLAQPWVARTAYINPPYSRGVGRWVDTAIRQYRQGDLGEAILLLAARTDTVWFHELAEYPICLVRGRLTFGLPPLSPTEPDAAWDARTREEWEKARKRRLKPEAAPFPSALAYLGPRPATFARAFSDLGHIVTCANPGGA